MPQISRQELVQKIRATKKFFAVDFKKRTDGQLRRMNCMNNVKVALQGGEKKFSDAEYKLITVYSVKDKGYRSIPIEGILCAQIEGETYRVV